MIKNLLLFCTVLLVIFSCGKKGDPFYKDAEKKNKQLNELTLDEFRKFEPKLTNDVFNVLNLEYSIKSKKSYGGTSFDNVKKMILKYKKHND